MDILRGTLGMSLRMFGQNFGHFGEVFLDFSDNFRTFLVENLGTFRVELSGGSYRHKITLVHF